VDGPTEPSAAALAVGTTGALVAIVVAAGADVCAAGAHPTNSRARTLARAPKTMCSIESAPCVIMADLQVRWSRPP
jgi:hypothetical protein